MRDTKYLEGNDHPSICNAAEHVCHVSISGRRNIAFSKVISVRSVETCRYYEGIRKLARVDIGK